MSAMPATEGMEGIEMRDFALEAMAAKDKMSNPGDQQQLQKPETRSALSRFWTTFVRITIEEEASRDHLALERTFLAYVRTASAYAQFGVLLAQLFRLNSAPDNAITSTTLQIGRVLGATTEGVAILVIICGAVYFAKQQNGLMKGIIVGRGWEIGIILILSFALFCVIFGLLAGANKW